MGKHQKHRCSYSAEKIRTESYLPVIDQFFKSLEQRISAYDTVRSRFGFLRNLNRPTLTADEIRNAAAELVLPYNTDLETCTENE